MRSDSLTPAISSIMMIWSLSASCSFGLRCSQLNLNNSVLCTVTVRLYFTVHGDRVGLTGTFKTPVHVCFFSPRRLARLYHLRPQNLKRATTRSYHFLMRRTHSARNFSTATSYDSEELRTSSHACFFYVVDLEWTDGSVLSLIA